MVQQTSTLPQRTAARWLAAGGVGGGKQEGCHSSRGRASWCMPPPRSGRGRGARGAPSQGLPPKLFGLGAAAPGGPGPETAHREAPWRSPSILRVSNGPLRGSMGVTYRVTSFETLEVTPAGPPAGSHKALRGARWRSPSGPGAAAGGPSSGSPGPCGGAPQEASAGGAPTCLPAC